MKVSELRQKSKEELEKMVFEHREKLRQLSFDSASGKIKNVREIRKTKKEIAQMLTLLRKKYA
jgi:large subunit ribosomal protein L29